MKTNLNKKMPKTVSALKARQNLGELLDRVRLRKERFLIERSGKPMAMIIGIEDYEDMEDLIDTLLEEADPKYQGELTAARKEYESGEVGTESDLWDSLNKKKHAG